VCVCVCVTRLVDPVIAFACVNVMGPVFLLKKMVMFGKGIIYEKLKGKAKFIYTL
jgi:hypothetical protein